jgi:DNA-binding response OmpR family regulator
VEAPSILVVEDDDLVRSFLCRALAGVAGEVEGCATGAAATAAVEHRPYGAILLDGLLPDTHGIELGKRLIEHPNAAHSGICLVSGSLRRPVPIRAGVSALPKPLRLHELTAAVTELLAWYRSGADASVERRAALEVLGVELLVG